jgi:hypothetical protein
MRYMKIYMREKDFFGKWQTIILSNRYREIALYCEKSWNDKIRDFTYKINYY